MADHKSTHGNRNGEGIGDDANAGGDNKAAADDPRAVPDYELDERLELSPQQLKVHLHETRLMIIDLLSERAATTSQLADALDKPKGTVGHHCKALEAAGLIRVVRTAKVRAMEERYYGRVARLYIMGPFDEAGVAPDSFLEPTLSELRASMTTKDPAHMVTARYARIPADRAAEWGRRLGELADEFAAQERDGDKVYGLMLGVFVTDRTGLK